MRPGSVPNTWKADWQRLRVALVWRHGEQRAADILAGRDPITNLDIARWRALGRAAA